MSLVFDDTVHRFEAFATPKVSEALAGQGQLIQTLDGGAFLAFQYRVDGEAVSVQAPRCVTFAWDDLAPVALLPLLVEAWQRQRAVTVTWPSVADETVTDTLTGYLPVQQPPEWEQTGAGCLRLSFAVQAARV